MEYNYLGILQDKLRETLRFTIQFMEEHGLRYYAYGGTCLGAIRHGDIIPWDDDIDIVMPYEDYKKLQSLKKEIDDTGKYRLYTPEIPGYYDPITRISDTGSTIWKYYLNAFLYGVQVDIFPLFQTNIDDETEIKRIQDDYIAKTERFQRANQRYTPIRFWENIKHRHLRGLIKNTRWALSTRHVERYRKEYEEAEAALHIPGGKQWVSYTTVVYGLEIYKMEWFSEYREVPFADFKIRVPADYDSYLKYVYGDYMKLPPEEKRHPSHFGCYINLKEELSIDEVRKRLKKGERCVY